MADMTVLAPYAVHGKWLAPDSLFLWGMGSGTIDAQEVKNHLFAWHAPSFYGTFIETKEHLNKEGVMLPAAEALDYFCGTPELSHRPFQWSGELADLERIAPLVREALVEGRYMPDYEQWRRGEPGWKLRLPEAAQAAAASPLVRAWTDALVGERVREQPELRDALRRLELTRPALAGGGEGGGGLWLDEEDWLVATGWTPDTSPFRTCLQLVEPEGGRDWRLQVALQDRRAADMLVPCSPDGEPLDADLLPELWREELPRVRRDVQRWLHILPMLRAGAGASGGDVREGEAAGLSAGTPAATDGAAGQGEPGRLREELSHDEAWEFLTRGSLRLAEAGCAVLLPAWWERVRRLKPRLRAKLRSAAGANAETMFGLSQILQFDWRMAIGDVDLSEAEFNELIETKRRLVNFRGQWIQLEPGQLEQIRQAMKRIGRKKGLSLRDVLELHLLGEAPSGSDPDNVPDEARVMMEVELNDHLRELFAQLQQHAGIPRVEPPASFCGSLRHYQVDGVSWMLFLRRFGLGGCLADDMGLGKTIQWITYVLTVKEREAEPGPSLLICPTSVLGNWQKELQRFAPSLRVHLHYGPNRRKGGMFRETAETADLVLTSYNLAHLDEAELGSVHWNSICLDEAQNIKNAYTKQAAAIRRLEGFHRIALTGTPIENRLTELWSIFDFLNPGYLGSVREFNHRFASRIERVKDQEAVAQVQRLIRPFLLRRVKKDPAIQLDLPDKQENKTFVTLTAEQASLYENHIRDMFDRVDSLSPMERRGLILSALTKLKQLCNHPSLLLKESHTRWRGRSNKVERLLDMVGELRSEGDRCLIFTQFVETGKLLHSVLEEELREPVQFLHGGTPKAARDAMIDRFQEESPPPDKLCGIFILSLKAGGTGLNLTAANHVFHFDRWWNPAVENQATDRAFRIGQTRDVQVHKFVTLGTLEERIDEMIERKLGLSQQIVGAGENWITEFSTDELRDLFLLRREWTEATL